MTENRDDKHAEPQGFSEHTRRESGEKAHEQGWGLNQDERTRLPEKKQDSDGGGDYEYGARDFGDEPVDTSQARPVSPTLERAEEFRGDSEGKRKGKVA